MNFLAVNWEPSIGINLGFFTIRWYSIMFVIAFLLGYRLMTKMYIKDGIAKEKMEPLFMYTFISMLVGMRLGDVFFYSWDYYQNHLLEIILPFKEKEGASSLFGLLEGWEFTGFTGFASHGAAVAIIIAMYFYSRKYLNKPILFILDRMGIVAAIGGAFVRLGNFFNSEIYGKATGSDFGVIFSATDPTKVPRHPTQLYEAFSYVILFVILYRLYWKTNKKEQLGYLFGVFMIGLWSLRFFIEFLKVEQTKGREDWVFNALNTGQVLSIPLILIGFWLIFRKPKMAS